MLVHQSKLFGKSRKEAPAEAEAASHKLLSRAGYIEQLAAGIFSLLPLGHRVNDNVKQIIREEMNNLGGQELTLPSLQPAALWAQSGRLETMDPPLFRVTDRHNRAFVLASTHEEVITDLACKHIESYQDIPLSVYQIHVKFRNEIRATGGLLRVREFEMKDLYSFHATSKDLHTYYERVKQAYLTIFKRCGINARAVLASSGSIGGSVSHEFSVESSAGEDKVAVCTRCDFAANVEVAKDYAACPECQGTLEIKSCIENGHIFQLGTKYSESLQAYFTDEAGNRQPLTMGCYGIGIGRLVATIAEIHHDDKGLQWPASVSPFRWHVVAVQPSVRDTAVKLAEQLHPYGDVLVDDREASAGQKFAESDLIGITTRIVVSEKTQAANKVEVVSRVDGSKKMMDPNELISQT